MRPVSGTAVTRPFSLSANPFARGQHRGADLAAAPGASVRSACTGVVVFAGVVPTAGRTVTVRCGRWRVTYLPLATAAVRRGQAIAARSRLGTVGRGHGGLHVGVRREGRAFGYIDPTKRFGTDPPPPVTVRPPRLGPAPRPLPRVTVPPPRLGPAPRALPRGPAPPPRALEPRSSPVMRPTPAAQPWLASWPLWVGSALLLTGAAGGRTIVRRRTRRRARVRGALKAVH